LAVLQKQITLLTLGLHKKIVRHSLVEFILHFSFYFIMSINKEPESKSGYCKQLDNMSKINVLKRR